MLLVYYWLADFVRVKLRRLEQMGARRPAVARPHASLQRVLLACLLCGEWLPLGGVVGLDSDMDFKNIAGGGFEVARRGAGCLWLDSMVSGKKYTWRIQPQVYVDGMPNAELVLKIASVTGNVWAQEAGEQGGMLRAYSCSGRTLAAACGQQFERVLPLQNATTSGNTTAPGVGAFFVSNTNDVVLEYTAGTEALAGKLGDGFTAVWFSRSHCEADRGYVEPANLMRECVPGGEYRLSTLPRVACSAAYESGNPTLAGCDFAGFSECPYGMVHRGKCWTISTTATNINAHVAGCMSWGGRLAPIASKDDHAMHSRIGHRSLRTPSPGGVGLMFVSLRKMFGSANSFTSFGNDDGSEGPPVNSTYIADSGAAIWWRAPVWSYNHARLVRHTAAGLPFGLFQGMPWNYNAMAMCARPMPADMMCTDDACFKRFAPANYSNARQTCREWGGHLAIPKTEEELLLVSDLGFGTSDPIAGVSAADFVNPTQALGQVISIHTSAHALS